MLVPKEDISIQQKKLKKFKKLSLKLYKKEYTLHQNEFVLLNKTKTTNTDLINNIGQIASIPNEGDPKFKGLLAQVAVNANNNQDSQRFFKQYDFNYHHNLNFPINENVSLHIDGNLSSKNDYGLYSLNPSVSYHTISYYYRAGLKLGPQMDCYFMTLKKWNDNLSTGILISFLEKHKFYKDKLVGSVRYKNLLAYASIGKQNLFGLKYYPKFDEKMKMFLNPYVNFIGYLKWQYGQGKRGVVTGFSRKITDESTWKFELTYSEWLWALKSTMILKLNHASKFFLGYELQNKTFYINIGFVFSYNFHIRLKIKQFYLGFPLFSLTTMTTDDLSWIAGMGLLFLGVGFLWDRIKANFVAKQDEPNAPKELTIEQKREKRQKELSLIARKVKDSYENEKKIKGLLIIEAYYGSKEAIAQLIAIPPMERLVALMKSPFDEKIVNVLDSVRFYVENSRLKLPKKSKKSLFGFYEPPHEKNEEIVLYIRYSLGGIEAEKIVLDTQDVNLP